LTLRWGSSADLGVHSGWGAPGLERAPAGLDPLEPGRNHRIGRAEPESRTRNESRPAGQSRLVLAYGAALDASRDARRVAVGDGTWSGSHGGDGAIRFEVVNTGREATDFTFAWSPEFRCADGSTHRYPTYRGGTELAWILRDGTSSLRQAEDDLLLTMQGTLGGGAGSGSFRIIETHPDARGACDTGPVAFTASRSP
jgi:hypothetical protein